MMRKRWPILLIGMVWLASLACGATPTVAPTSPASTGSGSTSAALRADLQRIKAQVFHQPYNAGEQELTDSPTTAGDGDRVRIPGAGKALLKWPDLHVLLYRATEMVPKNVTPKWISLGILAGTILAGGNLEPDQRLACDSYSAEVTMPGTTVMVAYHPGTGITIVRVFDGWAQVRNLQGEQRVEAVNAGEWALVKPGEAPVVSGDLTAMRALARELDLWDVFSEVELDVADGFSPAPVPRRDVEIVFVEEPAPASPAQPPEIACWPERIAVEPGGCTILGWDARYVEAVYLDGEQVAAQGEREVCPPESRAFEVRAESGAGVEYCRMAVDVPQRPPPVEVPEVPPPAEAPQSQPPAEVQDSQPPVIADVRAKPLSPSQERFEGYPSCVDRVWVLWRVEDASGVGAVSVISGDGGATAIQPLDGVYRYPSYLQENFTIAAEDALGYRAELPVQVRDLAARALAEAGYPVRLCIPLVSQRDAELYSGVSGQVSVVDCSPEEGGRLLGWIDNGDSVRYEEAALNMTPVATFVARVASATKGGTIDVLGEDPYYNPLVSCEIPGTGGWQNWVTVFCPLTKQWPRVPEPITLEFKGAAEGYLFNIDWFGFAE